jgi:protein-arginine kinase
LTDGGVGWLDASGPSSHLVLSTRIRLARNLAGRVFQGRNSESEREDILHIVEAAARDTVLLRRAIKFRLDRLERADRQLLHERHLVSKELAGLDADGRVRSGASLLVQDRLGVMLNEEDHLRLQGLHSGFALDAAYAEVDRLDAELGQRLAFAFHSEFGYLTSCPTNVGTGLRASVLIHLPGLVLTKEISKVLQGLAQVGLTFRGLYGEGSEVVGNFFQLSNQTTLGSSEYELLDHLGKMVRQVMDYEEQSLARVRVASLCTGSVIRRGNELVERRATGCGGQSHPRRRHVYAQQVVGIHPAGPFGGGGRTRSERSGPASTAGTVRAQSVGIRSGTPWMSRDDGLRSYVGYPDERLQLH